jgi:hypothetical protein
MKKNFLTIKSIIKLFVHMVPIIIVGWWFLPEIDYYLDTSFVAHATDDTDRWWMDSEDVAHKPVEEMSTAELNATREEAMNIWEQCSDPGRIEAWSRRIEEVDREIDYREQNNVSSPQDTWTDEDSGNDSEMEVNSDNDAEMEVDANNEAEMEVDVENNGNSENPQDTNDKDNSK